MRTSSVVFQSDDLQVLDVRCSCPVGHVDEEEHAVFEVVLPTAGAYRRRGGAVDATSAYVGVPGTEQTIEHVTDGDRCIALLPSAVLADELGLDRGVHRQRGHDALLARCLVSPVSEEHWLALASSLVGDRSQRRSDRSAAVGRVREAIAAEPGRPWRLRDLAAIAGYAPHHLSRVFRAETGTTITAHREQVRLAHALGLLADGMPIADVAATAGFADHAHLTRRASHALGVRPSQLRR